METIETKVININSDGDLAKVRETLNRTIKLANTGDELKINGVHEGFVFEGILIAKLGDKIIARNYHRDVDILTKETYPLLYKTFSRCIEKYSQAIKNSDEGGCLI